VLAEIDRLVLYVPECRARPAVVVYGLAHADAGAARWKPCRNHRRLMSSSAGSGLPGREHRLASPAHSGIGAATDEIAVAIAGDTREQRLEFYQPINHPDALACAIDDIVRPLIDRR
jgi:hypothetical protein